MRDDTVFIVGEDVGGAGGTSALDQTGRVAASGAASSITDDTGVGGGGWLA